MSRRPQARSEYVWVHAARAGAGCLALVEIRMSGGGGPYAVGVHAEAKPITVIGLTAGRGRLFCEGRDRELVGRQIGALIGSDEVVIDEEDGAIAG